jgi:sigma-B regulation protein RsbU (phosphoserine phosphatase)
MALIMSSRIANPLIRLAAYAKELSKQDFAAPGEETPPAIADLPESLRDEVGKLAESFIFMERSLRENIRNLMSVTAAKQRFEGELQVAREIQLGLLPKTFPPFPDRPELDLFATLVSAKQVGGDLYDFFFVDKSRLCFTVGDVSDKGAPAALFMAITKTLIKVAADKTSAPAEMMSMVNNVISRDNPNSMFCTLFIGVLDLNTGLTQFANGGHNPPVLLSKKDGVIFLPGLSGPMPGAMEDLEYKGLSLQLDPGDALLIYTDGVTEAMNEQGELFSENKLLDLAILHKDFSSKDMINSVMDAVREHAQGAQQSDDITMLCLRFLGPKAS